MNPKTLPRAGDKPVLRCVRYLRVSTKRQMDTDADVVANGNSIDTQRKACQQKEKALGLVCIDEYIEPGNSAQGIEKRPVFRQMLQRITEQCDVDCVVIYMRSRAFRNYVDAGVTKRNLEKLGVRLISAKEDFGTDLNGEVMEAITDVLNWWEVRRNGVDIKEKMANKVKNGGTPSKAKLGYVNATVNVDGRKVNTIAIDDERQPHVLAAFELFATGQHTIESLHKVLTGAGLRSRPTAKRPAGSVITLETLRSTLRDRYYIGWINFKGVEYKGRHETFISDELFERKHSPGVRGVRWWWHNVTAGGLFAIGGWVGWPWSGGLG